MALIDMYGDPPKSIAKTYGEARSKNISEINKLRWALYNPFAPDISEEARKKIKDRIKYLKEDIQKEVDIRKGEIDAIQKEEIKETINKSSEKTLRSVGLSSGDKKPNNFPLGPLSGGEESLFGGERNYQVPPYLDPNADPYSPINEEYKIERYRAAYEEHTRNAQANQKEYTGPEDNVKPPDTGNEPAVAPETKTETTTPVTRPTKPEQKTEFKGKTWEEHLRDMTILNTVTNLPALLQKRQEVPQMAVPKLGQATWNSASSQIMAGVDTQADRGMRSITDTARRYGAPGMISSVDRDAAISENAMKLAEADQGQMNNLNAMNAQISNREAEMKFAEGREARMYQFETDKLLAGSKSNAARNIMLGLFNYTNDLMNLREKIDRLNKWYSGRQVPVEAVNEALEEAVGSETNEKLAEAGLIGLPASYQYPLRGSIDDGQLKKLQEPLRKTIGQIGAGVKERSERGSLERLHAIGNTKKVIDKIPEKRRFLHELTGITSTDPDEFSKLINKDIYYQDQEQLKGR